MSKMASYQSLSKLIPFQDLSDPTSQFELLEILGTGTIGRVYQGKAVESGATVAIKIISHIPEHIVEIESEYMSYQAIADKKSLFPEFLGIFLHKGNSGTEDEVWFVMEMVHGITVADLLDKLRDDCSRFTEDQISYILRKVLQALKYLHNKNIIHRDIRAANLMIMENGAIKLFDFGFSAVIPSMDDTVLASVGSPYWQAPEVISCEQTMTPYGILCDIWSLGILAIELADTVPPLHHLHPVRAMLQIVRNPPPDVEKPTDWSENFKDFISECLIKNPDHRHQAEELLEHPFITQSIFEHDQISSELGDLVKTVPNSKSREKPHDVTVKNGHLKRMVNEPYEKMYWEDLAILKNPSLESMVEHLHQRFLSGQIYTYVGDILLALNSYRPLSIYGKEVASLYEEKARSDNPPHLYAMADRAFQNMQHQKRRQVILLYGPSGSGKTESMTHIIEHLVNLGESCTVAMNEKICMLCPLLESLGNAYLDDHPNSSRFVKSIEVTFTKTARVTGAIISTFMLETSRVSRVPPNGRNFHIFYQIYHGLKEEGKLSDFYLHDDTEYRCLPKLYECVAKDIEGYHRFLHALKILAFTEEETQAVLRILVAIILMGQIEFGQDSTKSSSCRTINTDGTSSVSKLLGVECSRLVECWTASKSIEDAQRERDSYMQSLYMAIVDWIVSLVNRQLSFSRLVFGGTLSVCVVDPPGFHKIQNSANGLWQLCFNILQDNLINSFHRYLFTKEFEEYATEEVNIPFQLENVHEDDLFLKRVLHGGHNLLSCIQDSSSEYSACDEKWKTCFNSKFKDDDVKAFYDINKETIVFQHVYDKVCYRVKDLVEENARSGYKPSSGLKELLESSQHSIIKALFTEVSSHERTGSSPFKVRCGGVPQRSPAEIVELSIPQIVNLEASEAPHVIVCVKANSRRQPNKFENTEVLMQLKCMKILEASQIRQLGFSTRLTYEEFLDRYKYLAFDFNETVNLDKANSRLLMVRLKMDGWELGKTKIFLKYYAEEYLSRLYETHVKMIVKVQALARRFIIRCRASKNRSG